MKQILIRFIQWVKKSMREKFHYQSEDFPYYLTIIVAIIIFGIALETFLELTEWLTENKLNPFDTAITNFIIPFRSDGLTNFFQFVTNLGDRNTYIAIIVLLAIFFWIQSKNWRFTIEIIIVLVMSSLTNIVLKKSINRTRPSHEHLVYVNNLSFPSGHSMSAMAFYGFLIYLCVRLKIPRSIKILTIIALGILILSIGISRIYLGVHYPSDVAAGFAGGLIWVTFCVVLFNVADLFRKIKSKKNKQLV